MSQVRDLSEPLHDADRSADMPDANRRADEMSAYMVKALWLTYPKRGMPLENGRFGQGGAGRSVVEKSSPLASVQWFDSTSSHRIRFVRALTRTPANPAAGQRGSPRRSWSLERSHNQVLHLTANEATGNRLVGSNPALSAKGWLPSKGRRARAHPLEGRNPSSRRTARL